jgi:hypothetical protein
MGDYQRSFSDASSFAASSCAAGASKKRRPKTGLAPTLLLVSARGSELRFVGNGEVVPAISDLVLAEGQLKCIGALAASWEWDGFHARWRGSM